VVLVTPAPKLDQIRQVSFLDPGIHSMSLAIPQFPSTSSSLNSSVDKDKNHPDDAEATLSTLLEAFTKAQPPKPMDSGATAFSQSGLPTPYPHAFTNAQSRDSQAEHASAVSNSATPTSEYGVYPASARSSNFSDHIPQYNPGSNHSGSSVGMAQPPSPSSMPLQDGQNHQNSQIKSDQDVPIDPSIAASSPTYPAHGNGQYSPYPPQQEMQHGYPGHPSGAMYQQPRPDWAGYAQQAQHGMPYTTGVHTPTSAASAGPPRPGQVGVVYSSNPVSGL